MGIAQRRIQTSIIFKATRFAGQSPKEHLHPCEHGSHIFRKPAFFGQSLNGICQPPRVTAKSGGKSVRTSPVSKCEP